MRDIVKGWRDSTERFDDFSKEKTIEPNDAMRYLLYYDIFFQLELNGYKFSKLGNILKELVMHNHK